MKSIVKAAIVAATAFSVTPASAGFLSDTFGTFFSPQQHQESPSVRRGHRRSVVERRVAGRGIGTVFASYYGGGEKLNRHTANGQVFRPNGLTVAHRTLPFGTRLAISHNGRTVVATVTDRGPAAWTGRSLDVSRGVAARLGFIQAGTAHLQIARLN